MTNRITTKALPARPKPAVGNRLLQDGKFPNRIREEREKLGRSRTWVAQQSGVPHWHQVRLEQWRAPLRPAIAQRLAMALGIPVERLHADEQLPAVRQQSEVAAHSSPGKKPEPRVDIAVVMPDGRVLGGFQFTINWEVAGELVRRLMRESLK